MALTAKQRRRIYHVLSVGKKKGASDAELLSALVTHRTESNYGNPSGGHGTSKGWRQQISGAGVKSVGRTNIRKQAGYYFDETRGKRGTPGQISNAVQRSAYPLKASEPGINREAREILKAFKRGKLGQVPGKGGGKGAPPKRSYSTKTTRTVTPGVDNTDLRQQLKASYLANRGNPSSLLALAGGLKEAGDVPSRTDVRTVKTPVPGGGKPRGGGGARGGKGGKRTATDIERIAAKAKSMGLKVSGNRGVTGRLETSGHTAGSNHYALSKNRRLRKKGWQGALDISGDPKRVRDLHRYLRKRYGRDMEELIHNTGDAADRNIKNGKRVGRGFYSGHTGHLHAADLD